MEQTHIRLNVTTVLGGIMHKLEASKTAVEFEEIVEKLVVRIARETKELEQIPAGELRALALHQRVDKAINSWREHDELAPRNSCEQCTMSGCCHLQVDVTEDEAELLVRRHRDKIDMERLALQQVPDLSDAERSVEENETRTGEFGKLTYAQRACVFLKDGKCSVYDDRPMTCRKWYIYDDPNSCSDWNHKGPIAAIYGAEVVATAAFSRWPSARLPTLVKKCIDTKNGVAQ